jgi:hypothetical protein
MTKNRIGNKNKIFGLHCLNFVLQKMTSKAGTKVCIGDLAQLKTNRWQCSC